MPALELAGQVPVAAGEVAKPDRVDIDGVEAGEGVDERPAGLGPGPLVEGRGRPLVADDVAVDEGHHVKGRTVDRRVGAQAQGDGHGHVGRPEGGDHSVLAGHVVGRREHVAQGRPSQGVGAAGGIGDPVGQVGAAAGDEVIGEGRLGALDGVAHPGRHPFDVDSLHCRARRRRLCARTHASTLPAPAPAT